MAVKITMPKLGLSMKVGTVAKWLKKEGDIIKKSEALLEVMTEKITSTIEAPGDGILLKIVAGNKVKLPIGGLLGIIGTADEDISQLMVTAAGSGNQATASAVSNKMVTVRTPGGTKVKISPAARKLAEDNGLDYTTLVGTGPEGRIVRDDVEAALVEESVTVDDRPALEVVPYEGMRQAIGENMLQSWTIAPKVTHHGSTDLSALLALRATINSELTESTKVSVTDLLVKAVARALEQHPRVNATLNGDEIRVLQDINVGVAIAVADGLLVPVVHKANKKSLADVSKEVKDFARRARRNKLEPDEMSGGTFTVTNLGGYGSVDYFTPIINQPESAILGVGRTVKRAIVVNDQVVIRPVMGLSLSFDHRVIDGAPAAEFLGLLIKLIEQPHKIFI